MVLINHCMYIYVYLCRSGCPPRGGGAVPGPDERALRPGVCRATTGACTCILLLHVYISTCLCTNTCCHLVSYVCMFSLHFVFNARAYILYDILCVYRASPTTATLYATSVLSLVTVSYASNTPTQSQHTS